MTHALFDDENPLTARQRKTDRLVLPKFLHREAADQRDAEAAEKAHPVLVRWADLESAGKLDKSNGRTPVDQCWDYLVNLPPECRRGIVSNFVNFRRRYILWSQTTGTWQNVKPGGLISRKDDSHAASSIENVAGEKRHRYSHHVSVLA